MKREETEMMELVEPDQDAGSSACARRETPARIGGGHHATRGHLPGLPRMKENRTRKGRHRKRLQNMYEWDVGNLHEWEDTHLQERDDKDLDKRDDKDLQERDDSDSHKWDNDEDLSDWESYGDRYDRDDDEVLSDWENYGGVYDRDDDEDDLRSGAGVPS